MDPKTIFVSIEKTREEIDAHVRRLAAVRQHPISMPAPLAGGTDFVADVLDAAMVAQVATTIEHLQAINQADDKRADKGSDSTAAEPPVVDLDPGQYREVDG